MSSIECAIMVSILTFLYVYFALWGAKRFKKVQNSVVVKKEIKKNGRSDKV